MMTTALTDTERLDAMIENAWRIEEWYSGGAGWYGVYDQNGVRLAKDADPRVALDAVINARRAT